MFGEKNKNTIPASTSPEQSSSTQSYSPSSAAGGNYVSKDVTISGKLKLTGDITIDGKLDGEINSKGTVTVSNNAVINASIFAKAIIVSGNVVGNLTAQERLEILQTAKVRGDVKTAVLKVDPGATFDGGCQVGASVKIEEPKATSTPTTPPAKKVDIKKG